MQPHLYELLHACTMRLSVPGEEGHGTGFFVASGFVLTCAHVVKEAQQKKTSVEMNWQGRSQRAQIKVFQPDQDTDLALLQTNLTSHPCVYLDEEAGPADQFYSFGYPGDRPYSDSAMFKCEGWTATSQHYGQPMWQKFTQGQVIPGMSGAPLLNLRTGYVCGIVAQTRDRYSNLGGRAIPVELVLQKIPALRTLPQQFHQQDRRWADALAAFQHEKTRPQQDATKQEGLDCLKRGHAALWRKDYTPAKRELEKALGLLHDDEMPKETAQARYWLALAQLSSNPPSVQGWSGIQSIENLMSAAIALHGLQSYFQVLARFKGNFFKKNGMQHRLHEVQDLLRRATTVAWTSEDDENMKLLSYCQPELDRDY